MTYILNLLITLLISPVHAAEPIKEMAMRTDVGEVVLTVEPCPLSPNYGFEYLAYATEHNEPDHLGCWQEPAPIEGKPQNQIINVWFKEINAVATYNKKLFKPRTKL